METPGSPEELSTTRKLALVYRLARGGAAGVWIYQGLVPKLIFRDWSEMTLLHDLQIDIQFVPFALTCAGFLEIGLGLLVLGSWRSRWPLWATIGAMVGSLASVAQHSPATLHAAFNPVTLNASLAILAAVALMAQPPQKANS